MDKLFDTIMVIGCLAVGLWFAAVVITGTSWAIDHLEHGECVEVVDPLQQSRHKVQGEGGSNR